MKKFAIAFLILALTQDAFAAIDQPSYGLFGQLHIARAAQPGGQAVFLFSDQGGWSVRQDRISAALAAQGAFVVGIDMASYLAKLESIKDTCSFPAGHVEELAHWVERHENRADYSSPLLIGDGAGANFAYAIATQAPSGTFSGVMTLGWDYGWRVSKPFCPGDPGAMMVADGGAGFRVTSVAAMPLPWQPEPWAGQNAEPSVIDTLLDPLTPMLHLLPITSITDDIHAMGKRSAADFVAQRYLAMQRLSKVVSQPLADGIADLPLIEVAPASTSTERIVVLLTGDGGWAGLDKGVAQALAGDGARVVGFSTLKYFWNQRSVEESTSAVARVFAHYEAKYPQARLALVGYSFGASLVPVIINRLPALLLTKLDAGVMISPDDEAVFEIKVGDWFGGGNHEGTIALQPEIQRIQVPIVCIDGKEENDSFCPGFRAPNFRSISLPGGHHYDGDYETLGRTVIDSLSRGIAPRVASGG